MAAGLLPRAARGSRLHRPVNVVVVIQALVVVVGVLVAVMGVLVAVAGVLVAVAGPGGGDGRTAPASMCSADLHSHPVL